MKGLLQEAQSWLMRVYLGRELVLPQDVQTLMRPDIVLWEEEYEEASERNSTKYHVEGLVVHSRGGL